MTVERLQEIVERWEAVAKRLPDDPKPLGELGKYIQKEHSDRDTVTAELDAILATLDTQTAMKIGLILRWCGAYLEVQTLAKSWDNELSTPDE